MLKSATKRKKLDGKRIRSIMALIPIKLKKLNLFLSTIFFERIYMLNGYSYHYINTYFSPLGPIISLYNNDAKIKRLKISFINLKIDVN